MTSREKILQAIASGKPDLQPLPSTFGFSSSYTNLADQFSSVLQAIGGAVVNVDSMAEVESYLRQHYDVSKPIMSLVKEVAIGNVLSTSADDPHQFENLYLVILKGQMGVAENGSIWLDEQNFTLRALPFISLHLAIIIEEEMLVGNMHEAYQQLSFDTGYGVFIAGPSKTADIEQSLVIGAHGPKSMIAFLIKRKPE